MKMTTNLTSVELLALSKHFADLAKEENARENISLGTHRVSAELVLKVAGTVNVGADEEYQPTAKIPLKTTLALFMKYSGFTGAHALATLEKAMKEASELGEDAAEKMSEMADLAATEKKVSKMLAKLPKATRAGKVKVAVVVKSTRLDV
jgi:hypothetical protein